MAKSRRGRQRCSFVPAGLQWMGDALSSHEWLGYSRCEPGDTTVRQGAQSPARRGVGGKDAFGFTSGRAENFPAPAARHICSLMRRQDEAPLGAAYFAPTGLERYCLRANYKDFAPTERPSIAHCFNRGWARRNGKVTKGRQRCSFVPAGRVASKKETKTGYGSGISNWRQMPRAR